MRRGSTVLLALALAGVWAGRPSRLSLPQGLGRPEDLPREWRKARVLPRVQTFRQHYTTPRPLRASSPEQWLHRFYSSKIVSSRRKIDKVNNSTFEDEDYVTDVSDNHEQEEIREFLVIPKLPQSDLNTLTLIRPGKVESLEKIMQANRKKLSSVHSSTEGINADFLFVEDNVVKTIKTSTKHAHMILNSTKDTYDDERSTKNTEMKVATLNDHRSIQKSQQNLGQSPPVEIQNKIRKHGNPSSKISQPTRAKKPRPKVHGSNEQEDISEDNMDILSKADKSMKQPLVKTKAFVKDRPHLMKSQNLVSLHGSQWNGLFDESFQPTDFGPPSFGSAGFSLIPNFGLSEESAREQIGQMMQKILREG